MIGSPLLMLSILTLQGLLQGQRTTQEAPISVGLKATFVRSNGFSIELDTLKGTLVTPRSSSTSLQDCGDRNQVYLTDHRGFAFAYLRRCDDSTTEDYRGLRFRPKVVTVLHNSDMWMVFDPAPRCLFHYAYSKGIVGIYLGATPTFDFRSVLRDRSFSLEKLDSAEYHIIGSQGVAACTS